MRVLLVVYDNGSYVHLFPIGVGYIATAFRNAGCEVVIYNQDKYHYPDEHLTRYLDNNKFDVIGLSFIAGYYQHRKVLSISEAINRSKQRPFYIIGGHGPSPEPEFYLRKTKADAAVIGEGEVTVAEFVDAYANKKTFHDIKGMAFWDGDKIVVNERRPMIMDVDSLPWPAYDLFPIEYYRLFRMPHAAATDFFMPVLSGRGCTFKCNFCYRMEDGYRARTNDAIIEEIRFLQKDYGINYISFGDELLMTSGERTVSLCEALLKAKVNIKWECDGRLNYAKPDVLKLMKQTGCVFINYGIESLDDQMLKKMNKALSLKQIVAGVEATIEAGISPGLNVIFGNIGETAEILNRGVEFLLKYDDGAQMRTIRPVTPYPGSPLYYHAIQQGLLKDCDDFYENKHKNSDLLAINFTDLTDEEFHKCLLDANTRLLTNYFNKKLAGTIEQARKLYLENDATFRGFRQS